MLYSDYTACIWIVFLRFCFFKQESSSSKPPPGTGTVTVHTRTVSQWRAEPGTSEDAEQLSTDSQDSLNPPLLLRSSRDRGPPRGQTAHPGSPRPDGAVDRAKDPARRQLSFGEEKQRPLTSTAQAERVTGTLTSQSFYETEVQTCPKTQSEKRRSTVNTQSVYHEEMSLSPSSSASTKPRKEASRAEGENALSNTFRSLTVPSERSTSQTGRPRSGEERTVTHTTRSEKTDSFKSRSCYNEEVVKTPKSRRIRSSEVKYTRRKLPRNPPSTSRANTPLSTLDQNSSSEGPEGCMPDDDPGYSSIGRNSPPRQRRRASSTNGAGSARSPYLTRSPSSAGHSIVSRQPRGHLTTMIRSPHPDVSPRNVPRLEDRGRWGSHSTTRDTISPKRLPDQVLVAAEQRVSALCAPRSWDSEVDQESVSSFSRAMEGGVSINKERWRYEKQSVRVRTSPRPYDTPEMDRPGSSHGSPDRKHQQSRSQFSPGAGQRSKAQRLSLIHI